jgi:hypothetical protein
MSDMPPLLTAADSADENLETIPRPAAVSDTTPAAVAAGASVAAAGRGVALSSSSGRLSTSSPPPPLSDESADADDIPELVPATDDGSSDGE